MLLYQALQAFGAFSNLDFLFLILTICGYGFVKQSVILLFSIFLQLLFKSPYSLNFLFSRLIFYLIFRFYPVLFVVIRSRHLALYLYNLFYELVLHSSFSIQLLVLPSANNILYSLYFLAFDNSINKLLF